MMIFSAFILLSIYPEIQNLLLQCRCEAIFAEAILPDPCGDCFDPTRSRNDSFTRKEKRHALWSYSQRHR